MASDNAVVQAVTMNRYGTAFLRENAASKVLDVGCTGFRVLHTARALGMTDMRHFGVDYSIAEEEIPNGVEFRHCDLNKERIPFEDDMFDLVVASHVIEHVSNPIEFFGELVRVTRPGGKIYIEAPSERSLFLPGMFMEHEKGYSLSFFDDPTHLSRPWTPQSLARLALCFSCVPEIVAYNTSAKDKFEGILMFLYGLLFRKGGYVECGLWKLVGWASRAVISKPVDITGAVNFRYHLPKR